MQRRQYDAGATTVFAADALHVRHALEYDSAELEVARVRLRREIAPTPGKLDGGKARVWIADDPLEIAHTDQLLIKPGLHRPLVQVLTFPVLGEEPFQRQRLQQRRETKRVAVLSVQIASILSGETSAVRAGARAHLRLHPEPCRSRISGGQRTRIRQLRRAY